MAEEILIDFVVNYDQLDSALDTLTNTNAIDAKAAAAFKQTSNAVQGVSKDSKGLVQTFNQVRSSATTMGNSVKKAFDQGVLDALDEAGVSMKEFESAIKKASTAPQSLKQELLKLTQSIAEAKANGKDLGIEFDNMVKRAGVLKDAIADANQEIRNAGSDTRGIDNVLGSVAALAGGFSVAQGAAALFGNESEDLQKTLIKVNGAMAIAQGLQQVSNALTKEGSLTKLADATATGFQTAAQKLYTAVTGKATEVTKAFKVALATTGILAVIGLVYTLADAMGAFDDKTQDATDSFSDLNREIERNIDLSNRLVINIDHQTKLAIDALKLSGASEEAQQKRLVQGFRDQQALKIKLHTEGEDKIREITKQKNKELERINNLPSQFNKDALRREVDNRFDYQIKKTREANDVLLRDANELNNRITESNSDFRVKEFDESKKNTKKITDNAAEERRKARQKILEDELAAIQFRLLKVEKGGQAEIDIQKEIIAKKSQIDLNAAGITENQIKLIKATSLNDQLELQREFNKKLSREQIENLIEVNNSSLAQLNISNEERLRLELENINAKADLEIQAAEGNISKLIAIDAKRESEIREAKKANIEKSLEDEIALNNLRTASGRRMLEQIVNDEKRSARERIAALQSITNADVSEIDKRISSLETEHSLKLISEEEYTRKLLELIDKRNKAIENLNAGVKGIEETDKKKKIDDLEEIAQKSIDVALKVADFFSQLNQLSADQENQRIEGQKQQLDALIEAGAITKKAADIRAKEIEIQERQVRQKQAQRDKQLAVFKALIAIPQAILEGLTRGGPILAAIYGGLAAATAAVIIARPIPKFAKGKKGNYSGLGEVGEAGSELIERNGRMFLTTKPTIMYLGPKDKVYTHRETKQILHNTDKSITTVTQPGVKIDYEKLAGLMSKNQSSTNINIDKDFIRESVENGLSKNNYFYNRYSFKK